jgi:5-methylcytosine-specific restriction endonuclease McrA
MKYEILNTKYEIQNTYEIRNTKSKTRNPKPEIRKPKRKSKTNYIEEEKWIQNEYSTQYCAFPVNKLNKKTNIETN